MPAVPDLSDGEDSSAVGFLDLPHLAADRVIDAILDGFSRLDVDAVLTAYCTDVDVNAMARLCAPHGVELVHSVSHASGTTFVLKLLSP